MKAIAMIAATGSLATIGLPVHAADMAPETLVSTIAITGSENASLMDPPPHAKAYGKRAKDRERQIYNDRGYYIEPRKISRTDRIWRGKNGRYYCKRGNGTTGLVIGAGVGALAGVKLAKDKTLGAIVGGAAGALIGREIDRGNLRCR